MSVYTKGRRTTWLPVYQGSSVATGGSTIADFVDVWYDINWAAANSQLWQESGKTTNATAQNDPVHVIGPRKGTLDLVWQGGATNEPTLPAGTDSVLTGNGANYFYQSSAFTAVPSGFEIIFIHSKAAGNEFTQMHGWLAGTAPVLQDNGANIRMLNGATATFSGGSLTDGVLTSSRCVYNGTSSQYWENNTQISTNQDAGSSSLTRDIIGFSNACNMTVEAYMRINSTLSAGDWTTLWGLIQTEYGL